MCFDEKYWSLRNRRLMALKYYQDRLRKENENKVVQAKVQGDAKPLRVEGVPEVGQFGLQNPP